MLGETLPGRQIQYEMSPVPREAEMYYDIPAHARLAAVLALLIPIDGEWHITFIKRPSHSKDKHAGQISFPGGGLEKNDDSMEACALRETQEEIGIPSSRVTIIGGLTKLYVYASNNLVYPYVGYLENKEEFKLQRSEVAKVITTPLSYFSDEAILKKTDMTVRGFTLKEVPYFDLNGEVLWGATAMMMSELNYLWKQIQ